MKLSSLIALSFVVIVCGTPAAAGEAGGLPAASPAAPKKALKAKAPKKAATSPDIKAGERALFTGPSGTGKPLATPAETKPTASGAK